MLKSIIVYSNKLDSAEAGKELGSLVSSDFQGEKPDAVIIFASSRYNYSELLKSINFSCNPKILIGCSSAGEFVTGAQGEGSACLVALRSTEMQFGVGLGRDLSLDRGKAAAQIASTFQGNEQTIFGFRSAIVLTDALAGHTDDFIKQLTLQTGGKYQFIGGGAGDDAQFKRTHVFYGTESYTDAAVALEILSNKPVGMGVAHGWKPTGSPFRVTEASSSRLVSLNSIPVLEIFTDHAKKTAQEFDPKNPLPFFLHNVIGIDTGEGNYKLRVPLAINEDGSISCASDIPEGAMVSFMQTTDDSAIEAAENATNSALRQLGDHEPGVALFFDCVATRIRMGKGFDAELKTVGKILGDTRFVGANTYGQIARAEGQFSGFHNCTATVCVLPN